VNESAPTPVSVIIAVRDEADAVVAAIASALRQRYDGPLEVVVAVAPSNDGTRGVVAGVASRDRRVRLVDNPATTTSAGLNTAIRASSGRVIVRCDAHSVLPPGYVAIAVDLLEATGADVVGGIMDAVGHGVTGRAVAAAMSNPLGVGDARFHMGGPAGEVDTVYLGVFRRRALEEAGLFDEKLERNQDYELNYRIRAFGGSVYFDPRLAVEYRPRSTLSALWRQYFDYGRGKRRVLHMHPGSLRWRQLAAPALVVGLGASALLTFTPARRLALLTPMLYASAVIAATGYEVVHRGDAAMVSLPAVFPTMHFAWGIGFLIARRAETSDR
jgi:glycosyltransferase involved in cell wall biosynthesis